MEKVFIDLNQDSYYIYIEGGLLNSVVDYIGNADKWMIITDENVDSLYTDEVMARLVGEEVYKYIIKPGETSKTFLTVEHILNNMIENRLTRRSKIIALGGGVVGDIAGFCASIYMRGIPFVQIPTTLLAQVDSSVGGKTGVNMTQGKNMVGSFYQPKAVVVDIDTLKSLPQKELISGMGEVVKYGVIWDYDFLTLIEENLEDILKLKKNILSKIIKRCCEIKAEVVSKDEKEMGLRKILNFGHTIGHALEAQTNYNRYTHGEAVLIGMYYEALMAKNFGYIEVEYFEKIKEIITRLGISLDISEFSIMDLVESMTKDKKNKDGKISFIFPKGRGKVEEVLLDKEEILW